MSEVWLSSFELNSQTSILAYSHWMRGEFGPAVDWASKGVALKSESDVDTDFDCKHNLALAQRDAGEPEVALKYFLGSWKVEDLIGADGVPTDGPMYGNVGRCLQMMNRLDDALACYRRSMSALENDVLSPQQVQPCLRSTLGSAKFWLNSEKKRELKLSLSMQFAC